MNLTEIKKEVKTLPNNLKLLTYEIGFFVVALPRYFIQFFKGLREFSDSYSGVLKGLEDLRKSQEIWMKGNVDSQVAASALTDLINSTIELKKEHEKMFSALFGILIAVLALIISVVALFVSRG